MKKNLLLIVLLMTLIPLAGYSQNETSTQFTVAGVIVDATGEPLVGTAVYVKNEPGVGVVADLDGKFKIKVTKNATLIFQSVGMKNVEMLITKNEEKLKIVMKEDETKIDEVVVTGMSSIGRYGCLCKERTGSRRSSGSGRKVQDKSNEKRYTDIPVSGYEECRDADYQKRRKA